MWIGLFYRTCPGGKRQSQRCVSQSQKSRRGWGSSPHSGPAWGQTSISGGQAEVSTEAMAPEHMSLCGPLARPKSFALSI